MDEEHLRRELSELLWPRFEAADVSEDQRRGLVESLRSCGATILDVFSHMDEPVHAAHLLRMASLSCHRFADLAKQIGATEPAKDAQVVARDLDTLANEAESLGVSAARLLLIGWG